MRAEVLHVRMPVHADRVAGISFLATRPTWRQQGIGTFVTSWLMQRAGAAGATRVALSSFRAGFRELFRCQLWRRQPTRTAAAEGGRWGPGGGAGPGTGS
ncbi:MAG: GNAT family N-acetyltransferase [Clostridia bacterium]